MKAFHPPSFLRTLGVVILLVGLAGGMVEQHRDVTIRNRQVADEQRHRARALDQDPYLLNVANGTIDLRTGLLGLHDPADMLTKISPVNYDPAARSEMTMAGDLIRPHSCRSSVTDCGFAGKIRACRKPATRPSRY